MILINEIKSYGDFKIVKVFNNQLQDFEKTTGFVNPACFVELERTNPQRTMNNYTSNDMILSLHLIYGGRIENTSSDVDTTLSLFDTIYNFQNKFSRFIWDKSVEGVGSIIKNGETQTFDNNQWYHIILKYQFFWIDSSIDNRIDYEPGTKPIVTVNISSGSLQ